MKTGVSVRRTQGCGSRIWLDKGVGVAGAAGGCARSGGEVLGEGVGPAAGCELGDQALGMRGQTAQHVAEVEEGIDL